MKKLFTLFLGLLICISPAFSQKKKKDTKATPAPTAAVKSDTTKKKGGIQPYKQLITSKAKTKRGLFTTHKINEDIILKLPTPFLVESFWL
jgi:hypothetical protein